MTTPNHDENDIADELTHDDVVLDETEEDGSDDGEAGGAENTGTATIKKLRERLAQALKEKQEYLDSLQRMRADFVNVRKKDEEHRGEFIQYAKEQVLSDLLPVLESFDSAFANQEAWAKVPKEWATGIEYIHSQLMGILGENSLKVLMPNVGDKFDPALHASVSSVTTDNPKEDHTIASIEQKGYSIGNKVLKPPRVTIKEYLIT